MHRGLLISAALATGLSAQTASAQPPTSASAESHARGMVVSCPGYGEIWGTEAMREAVVELAELGVDWVQIHPYARIERDGRVSFRPAADRGYMSGAVEIVRSEGLQLFLKPHLSYWGNFTWRGAIEFADEASWDRFFQTYRAFIVDQARFAERHGVPALAVGTELERTVEFEARWREIIAAVRAVYSGHLTYAANWDSLHKVEFWDDLDSIGVQAYFPLGDSSSTRAELKERFASVISDLRGLSEREKRPVVIAEIGYTRSTKAAREPWHPERDSSPDAIRLRTTLADVALEGLSEADFILGVFWWKWIPGWSWFHRDFSMRDPEMKGLLERHWKDR